MTTLKTAVLQTIAFMALDFLTKESIILGYRSSVSEDSLISGKTVLQKAAKLSFTCGCYYTQCRWKAIFMILSRLNGNYFS